MSEILLPEFIALDKAKFYHIKLPDSYTNEELAAFVRAVKHHGFKAFVTVGNVVIEPLIELYNKLTPDHQDLVKKAIFAPEKESIDIELVNAMRGDHIHVDVPQPPPIPEGNAVNPEAHIQTH